MHKILSITAIVGLVAFGIVPTAAQVTTPPAITPFGLNPVIDSRQHSKPVTVPDSHYPFGYYYDPITHQLYRRFDCTSPYSPYYNSAYCADAH